MKDVSQNFIDNEEADKRMPVELYHIWRDGAEHWYYTSGDVTISFDGNDYVPATLSRSLVKYSTQFEVTTMSISADYLQDATIDFISTNPIEILWVSVMKLHREQSPLEASVVFIGQIKDVGFKGIQGDISCVGFEHFLKKTVPVWRYILTCNHDIFDSFCTLSAATYLVTETITLDASKSILTGAAFGGYDDGYFIGGEVKFGLEARAIVGHVGTSITMAYSMAELVSANSVDVYPGCNGRAETCRDTYDNILNFLGMPFIPMENPATRIE